MDVPVPLQAARLWMAFTTGNKADKGGGVGNKKDGS